MSSASAWIRATSSAPQRLVNGPVARNARQPLEGRRPNPDIEVTFATFLIARMATVTLAIIDDLQLAWRKGRFQPSMNFLCH